MGKTIYIIPSRFSSFFFFILQILIQNVFFRPFIFIFLFSFILPFIIFHAFVLLIPSAENFLYTQCSEILFSSFSLKTNILHPVLSDILSFYNENVSRRRDAIGDAPFIFFKSIYYISFLNKMNVHSV